MTSHHTLARRWIAVSVALVLCVPLAALAATDRWQPYPPGVGGPWGGSVRRLVAAGGSQLWAATGGGVFASVDGGATWADASSGLEGLDVTDLAVCAAFPANLIAATAAVGLYLSADAGATWTRVPAASIKVNGRAQNRFWRVAADPVDPNRLYAATFDDSTHLFRSADGGTTWQDLGGIAASRLVVTADGTLYAGTRDGRIYRKRTADTWPVLQANLCDDPGVCPAAGAIAGKTGPEILDLAVSDSTPAALVAAQAGAGLWVASDAADSATYVETHFAGGGNPDFLVIDAATLDPLDPTRLVYHVDDPNTGAATQLLQSRDGGATVTALPLPEEGLEILSLALDPAAEWLGCNKAGAFARLGRAGRFAHRSAGLAAAVSRGAAVHPGSGMVAAAVGRSGQSGNGGVHLWDGAAWARLAGTIPPIDTAGYTGFPAASTGLARWVGSDLWLGVDGWGLYRSADLGVTWEERTTGIAGSAKKGFSGLAFDPSDLTRAVSATLLGVYRSADGGAAWTEAVGVPLGSSWGVGVDGGTPPRFYTAGRDGNAGRFFASGDAGATWQESAAAVFADRPIVALAASAGRPGHVAVGTRIDGAFETLDGGATWRSAALGGPGWGEVQALTVGRSGGIDWLVASITGLGVFRVAAGGDAVSPWMTGLPGAPDGVPRVLSLDLDPTAPRVVAALDGRGLWYLDLPTALDADLPVLTRVGDATVTWEAGVPFVDLWGATASDPTDGDLTAAVHSDAAEVDAGVLGSTLIRYDVADTAGHAAEPVFRTVIVADTVPPVITLAGANPLPWEAGSSYADPGATAQDAFDGDRTVALITDASGVDTAVVGSYAVGYFVTDIQGNPASATRTVQVSDSTPPVLTLLGADPLAWPVDTPYVDPGATATDAGDGDLTAAIVTDAAAVNPAVVGSYTVTYTVADAAGNTDTATRTVRVVAGGDFTPPVLTLLGADPLVWEAGSAYQDPGATATDAVDGDLTGAVVTDAGAVDTAAVGSYAVAYTVADAAGNEATATRTVNVVDSTPPVLIVLGDAPQVIEVGVAYQELGATATDAVDGDLTAAIGIDAAAVDTVAVGSYTVTYTVADAAGNETTATRTVQVVPPADTVPPTVAVTTPGGLYLNQITVGLAADEVATIYYTTDGTEPTMDSRVYATALVIGETTTLKFFARDTAGNQSPVQTVEYTITAAAPSGGGGGGGGCFLKSLVGGE